jgi:predicted small lipoprotein YifL
MTLTTKILSILLLAFALGACGQSGPLYVPGDPSEIKTQPQSAESEDDGDENGEEDDGQ